MRRPWLMLGAMCPEGMVPLAILVLVMVATGPATVRLQKTNLMAGSLREPTGHSMCTSDPWKHKDSMRQRSVDLHNEVLEEGAVSSACLATWLVEVFFILLMILDTPR